MVAYGTMYLQGCGTAYLTMIPIGGQILFPRPCQHWKELHCECTRKPYYRISTALTIYKRGATILLSPVAPMMIMYVKSPARSGVKAVHLHFN